MMLMFMLQIYIYALSLVTQSDHCMFVDPCRAASQSEVSSEIRFCFQALSLGLLLLYTWYVRNSYQNKFLVFSWLQTATQLDVRQCEDG